MRSVAAVIALVACVQAGLWALTRESAQAPNFDGQLASVSYAHFGISDDPNAGDRARPEQIRADMKLLAPVTRAIRLYCEAVAVAATKGNRAAVVDSGADIGALDNPLAEEAVEG